MNLQRYVSPDLTHFVGRSLNQERCFALLKKIIRQGVLQARPRRRGLPHDYYETTIHDRKLSSNRAYQGMIVCFCDIPQSDLALHMDKYSRFGIAFRKDFLIEHGVTPVMYVPHNGRPSLYPFKRHVTGDPLPVHGVSSQAVAFDRLWEYFNAVRKDIDSIPSEFAKFARDLEKIITFLDDSVLSHLKFFKQGLHDDHHKNYYMEREWRASKDVPFEMADIQRVIIPTAFARRLHTALKDYDGEVFFAD